MSPINIPLENWLGALTDNKLISSEVVQIKRIGLVDPNFDFKVFLKQSDAQVLTCAELIFAINDVLNTDKTLWPEGIRQDLSNIAYVEDDKGECHYTLVMTKDDTEDYDLVLREEAPVIVKFTLRNPRFIEATNPVFMELITSQEFNAPLNRGDAVSFNTNEGAPMMRVMTLHENSPEAAHRYMIKTPIEDLFKVSVVRYFNKVIPSFIHEDMMDKILVIQEVENEKGQTEFVLSFDLYGRIYLLYVVYDPTYDPKALEEDDANTI